MIGSFITRGLAMVFGYAYPAYECYKTIEKNKPEIEQLRFWCQYWILVAVWTVCERFSDAFVSWVPMYSEAKLAFFIYLWYPKTKGTTYVYDSFFRPLIAKHETEIDRSLLELKTRAGDIAVLYWQKAASYGQTRVFEILQYFASQSTLRPHPPPQPQLNQKLVAATQPPPLNQKLVAATQSQAVEPSSPTPSVSSKDSEGVEELAGAHPQTPRANPPKPETITQKNPSTQSSPGPAIQAPPTVAANALKAIAVQATTEKMALRSSPSSPAAAAVMSSGLENANPPPQETLMEEAVRVTRGRLRRARSAAASR